MKITGWRAKEILDDIADLAVDNANEAMDEVVRIAKSKCEPGTVYREGGFTSANVSFVPKTGRHKGERVEFETLKRWKGRKPGSLRSTIRRVTMREDGNVRVYAGNFKIYYALYVERGTTKMEKKPFLRPAFMEVKPRMLDIVKNGK